jgi:hypothetical protein
MKGLKIPREHLLFSMRIGDFNIDLGWTLTVSAFSVLLIVGSVILAFMVVKRIPRDYFLKESAPTLATTSLETGLLSKIVMNGVGVILVFAGIAMLLLPGQGILTILAGLLLIDFPGKYRITRRLVAIPTILKVINAIRANSDLPPLQIPPKHE